MRDLVRAPLFAFLLAGPLASTAFAAKGGDHGPDANASVSGACVSTNGFEVTVAFMIETKEDHDRCIEEGNHPVGLWDLDFFLRRFRHFLEDHPLDSPKQPPHH